MLFIFPYSPCWLFYSVRPTSFLLFPCASVCYNTCVWVQYFLLLVEECGWFIFWLLKSIFFHCFSIFYMVPTCYIYIYCIPFGFNKLFSYSFAEFLLFSPKISVTGCVWLLALQFLLFYSVLPFAYASSFWLLLLRLCSNRCAGTLAVKMKFSIESPLLRLMRLFYQNNNLSSVSFSTFILAVSMRKCLSSAFYTAILNCTCFFCSPGAGVSNISALVHLNQIWFHLDGCAYNYYSILL